MDEIMIIRGILFSFHHKADIFKNSHQNSLSTVKLGPSQQTGFVEWQNVRKRVEIKQKLSQSKIVHDIHSS